MRLVLVINRSAGAFRRLPLEQTIAALATALRSGGHEVVVEVCGRREVQGRLAALVHRPDAEAVIVGGGDGTILTAILSGLGQGKPLGVLPLGTLNLLARDLALPLDPLEAARQLAHPTFAAIDLAEVNGLPFAIWASMGMHPWVVRRRDKMQKEGIAKWPAFVWAMLRALWRFPMMKITFTAGDKDSSTTLATPLLMISNNAWREESLPLTRETLDQGELVLHVVEATSRRELLWLALLALCGVWKTSRFIKTFPADEIRVSTRKHRVMVSLDGEVTALRSPLVFRLRPKALTLLMPSLDQGD